MKTIVFCIPASVAASEARRNEIMAFVSGLNQRHGGDAMRIRCEIRETISGETSPEADTVYVSVGEGAEDVKQRILLALTEEMGPDALQEEYAALGLPRTAGKRANPRQVKALRLLDEGEYEKALSTLQDPAWKAECRRAEEEMQLSRGRLESGLETICQYISGQRTLISTLGIDGDREAAAEEIRAIYEEITALAEKYAVCAWVLCDYANFLYERHQFDAALAVADRFDALTQQHPEAVNDAMLARTAQIQGMLFCGRNDFAAGEAACGRALEIGLRCARRDLDEFDAYGLLNAMNTLARLQQRAGKFQQAEETYRRGLEGLRPLEEQDPEEYEHLLEDAMSRFADLLRHNGRLQEAEQVYRRLVEIYESWDLEFEQAEYLCALAHLLAEDCHRPQEAEEMYREAMEILICLEGHQLGTCAQFGRLMSEHRLPDRMMEELRKKISDADEPDLAGSLNMANQLADAGRYQEAEEMFRQALEIRRRLAEQNPGAYEPELAGSLFGLANLLYNAGRHQEAEEMHRQALEIRRRLAEQNPGAYELDFARSLHDLAVLLYNTGRQQETEEPYRQALEIFQRLAKKNPDVYEPYVATSLSNLANVVSEAGHDQEAEEMYHQAMEIYRRLAQKRPDAYESELADCLNNLAVLLVNTGRQKEAEEMFNQALSILWRLAEQNPKAYLPHLATVMNNLSTFPDDSDSSVW